MDWFIVYMIVIGACLPVAVGVTVGLAIRRKIFPAVQPERLELVHRSALKVGIPIKEIYRDAQTGAQYLVVRAGYGVSVVPVLDREGKPLVAE